MSEDLIKRSDAIEAAGDMSYIAFEIRRKIRMIPSAEPMPEYIDNILIVRHYCNGMVAMNEECYKRMQSVDPITTEQAIEHLQECGWLQEHDRILTEPKRGEWIYGEHDVAMCDGYRCDRCGFFVPWDYEHKSIDFINDYHFCPNCGAKMVNGKGGK